MVLEQHIPQELVALSVQALADHQHSAAQRNLANLRIAKRRGPGSEIVTEVRTAQDNDVVR